MGLSYKIKLGYYILQNDRLACILYQYTIYEWTNYTEQVYNITTMVKADAKIINGVQ